MCRDSARRERAGWRDVAPMLRNAAWPADANLRIGDHEREEASVELRAHFAAGRLDVDEFSSRLDEVYRATVAADIDRVMRDLPRTGLATPPAGARPQWAARTLVHSQVMPRVAGGQRLMHRAYRAHVRTFVVVMALLVAIWALTGGGGFWPVWPLAFWGFFVFRHHRFDRRWGRRVDELGVGQNR